MPSQWLEHHDFVLVGEVQKQVLRQRMEALGWKTYRLAQEVAKIRKELYGDDIKGHRSLITNLDRALDNPETATGKTLEAIILALGGKLQIQWTTEKVIIETAEVDLSTPRDEDSSSNDSPDESFNE